MNRAKTSDSKSLILRWGILRLGILSVALLTSISGYQTTVASHKIQCIFEEYKLDKQPCFGQDTFCPNCHQTLSNSCPNWEITHTKAVLYGVKTEGTKWYKYDDQQRCRLHRACIATPVAGSTCKIYPGGYSICLPTSSKDGCFYCSSFGTAIVELEESTQEVDCNFPQTNEEEG